MPQRILFAIAMKINFGKNSPNDDSSKVRNSNNKGNSRTLEIEFVIALHAEGALSILSKLDIPAEKFNIPKPIVIRK